jgi:hypothetical protein
LVGRRGSTLWKVRNLGVQDFDRNRRDDAKYLAENPPSSAGLASAITDSGSPSRASTM